jgi:MerR family transcriptional regulator, repressor of the yfmOP operon
MANAVPQRQYKIGEVAEHLGITARTIRYYEERGLLDVPSDRAKGSHRLYTEADIARLHDLLQLREFLGLTLEELTELAEVTQAQQCLQDRWDTTTTDEQRVRIIRSAIPNVQRQLQLVQARQRRLADFAQQLTDKLDRMHDNLRRLSPRRGRR